MKQQEFGAVRAYAANERVEARSVGDQIVSGTVRGSLGGLFTDTVVFVHWDCDDDDPTIETVEVPANLRPAS
jgi:hypothetical protein